MATAYKDASDRDYSRSDFIKRPGERGVEIDDLWGVFHSDDDPDPHVFALAFHSFDVSRILVQAPLRSMTKHLRSFDDRLVMGSNPTIASFPRENAHREFINTRVDALREDAAEDGESFDEASARFLIDFCDDLAAAVRPAIFRLPTGTLRALWEDRSRERQIGLQFLTDGLVQYVLLRPEHGSLLKTLGVDRPHVVRGVVDATGLRLLWFRG